MRLQISEHELNAATKAAIRYLVHEADMSQTEIGQALGYPDGGMVGKALRGDAALGPVKLVNLARLASAHGHTDLSELFSAPSYACVPALEGQSDDRWETNRCVVEEVAGVTLGAGSLHAAVEDGDLSRARRWWNVGLTWWRRCRAELDEIAERGWPGRFGVSAQTGGDGLPIEATVSL